MTTKKTKLAPTAIAEQRAAFVQDWFMTDTGDLTPDELASWQKWFSPAGPTNEEAIARAMAPVSEGGLGMSRHDRAERLVARAEKQLGAQAAGRPQTHARPTWDMRKPVYVHTRHGKQNITTEDARIVAANGDSITLQIGERTMQITTSPSGVGIVDWFEDAP